MITTLAINGFWRYWLVLFIACQLMNVPARASLDPSKAITQYAKLVWKSDSGLPQDSVLALAQTADGYVWMGTEEGLVRFDGVRFTVYDKGNTAGLRRSAVISLLVDHAGTLWIGTHGGGLTRFSHGKFEEGLPGNWLADQSVQCLYEDKAGALWIGTSSGGVVRYFHGQLRTYTSSEGLADNTVFSISGDKSGALWIGTHKGLSKFSGGTFTTVLAEDGTGLGSVRATYVDRRGALWVAANSGGLLRLGADGMKRITTKNGQASNAIQSLHEDRAGTLWIGTLGGGLDHITGGDITSYKKSEGPNGYAVQALLEDREGNLWIGCVGGGLTRLRDGVITTISKEEGLSADITLPVYQDKEGAVWIGTVQGLNRLKDGHLSSFTTADGLPDKLVFSVTQSGDGVVWIGTHKGLARLVTNRFVSVSAEAGLPSGPVMCTYTDTAGDLWVGTRGGLSHFDGKHFTTYTTKDGLSNNFVMAIHQSSDKTLWIGTDGGGLNSFRDGKFEFHTMLDKLAGNIVSGLTSDPDGTLWIGTRGGGLSRLRSGKFTNYSSRQGLTDDTVLAVVDDELGRLWMSSNKGIFSVEKKQLEQLDAGLIKKITAASYGIGDGMKNRECDGGFQPAGWRTQDGRIWFPTVEGVSAADPAHVGNSSIPLSLMIEDVFVDGKEQVFDKPLTVSPGNGKLAFHFTAPTFISPEKVQFRYMLEGFDKDWTQEEHNRAAYYTNIPPGEYRFRVLASRDGQKWYGEKVNVAFTLQPRYYQTLGFAALMGILVAGCALALHRVRVGHLRDNERKLVQLVEKRTSELRQSRDDLEIRVADRTLDLLKSNLSLEAEVATRTIAEQKAAAASQAKTQFLTNMSHEIRTPINGIMGMTDLTLTTEVTSEQREYLEIVRASADSLLLIVKDIMDFSQMESGKLALNEEPFRLSRVISELEKTVVPRVGEKGLLLNIKAVPGVPDRVVGDPIRLRQVLLNLLDNGVKFTNQGNISLHIEPAEISDSNALLHFSVTDTGIGISDDKLQTIFEAFSQGDSTMTRRFGGAGLGLTISSRLAQMMNGNLWVESKLGAGSTFHFTALLGIASEPAEAPGSVSEPASLSLE